MVAYAAPKWLVWFVISFVFVLLLFVLFLLWQMWKKRLMDIVLMIDKNNRWKLTYTNLRGLKTYTDANKKYYLSDECGLLSHRGKALYIFSENKPQPFKMLSYNKAEWLDSESLAGVINNKLVQQIIKPQDKMIDMLILFGAIGGMIAGVSSVVILLMQTGVIGST